MMRRRMAAFVVLVALGACGATSRPADVTTSDVCGHCRMVVSNPRFAGQIAAPGEDPVFFDDIGCLAKALAAGGAGEFAYVADHRTGQWIRATDAVYTRVETIATPMGSHIIAHADRASREQDPAAAKGTPMLWGQVLNYQKTDNSRPDPLEGSATHGR